jgi:hypothetical protein
MATRSEMKAYNSGRVPALRQQRGDWSDPTGPRPATTTQQMLVDTLEMMGGEQWAEILESSRNHTVYGNFALRQMAKSPWIACILQNMINKLLRFANPQRDPYSLGFRMLMRERKKSPTKVEEAEGERLARLMVTCGEFRTENERYTRKYFDQFLQEVMYDSFVLDGCAWDIVENRKGKPACWSPVDAAEIFKVFPENPYGEYDANDAMWVQRKRGKDVAWFRGGQLNYGVRRSRTDVSGYGYGYPELVELLEIVTAMMTAWSYNQKYFSQGGPKGVVSIEGDMDPKMFKAFQRQMQFQAAGIKNAFRTVFLQIPSAQAGVAAPGGIKYVPFGMPNKEMEFGQWVDANFKIGCSLFGVEPGETGFYFPASGVTSQMNESSPEAKLRHGEARWMHPTLRKVERWLNTSIVWRLNEDYEICFLGDDAMSEKERAELSKLLVGSTHTVDEGRALMDMRPLPDGLGEYIDAPMFMQMKQQKAMEDQAAMGGMPGDGSGMPDDGSGGVGGGGGQPGAATGDPGAQAGASGDLGGAGPDDWGEWGEDIGQDQGAQPGQSGQAEQQARVRKSFDFEV